MSLNVAPSARLARDWWRELADGMPRRARDGTRTASSGALARLRRTRTPLEAMMHAEVVDLMQRIDPELVRHVRPDGPHWQEKRLADLAGLAILLAHVHEDDPSRSVAGRLGGNEPDNRLMKPARFRRLMLATGEDRLVTFRRAVRLLSSTVNVGDLATGWLMWDHPDVGMRTRSEWMFRYVGARESDDRRSSDPDVPDSPSPAIEEAAR